MLAAAVFVVGFLVVLALATLRQKDAWPLSHYPMFSRRRDPEQVRVFRVALETTAGETIWWRPAFPRYSEEIGRRLGQIDKRYRREGGLDAAAAPAMEKILLEVVRLISGEPGALDRYRAVCVVRRVGVQETSDAWAARDTTIARFPLETLTRRRHAA